MAMMIAHLGVKRLDWIGTSLGGLIGMVLAAARGTPIQRIVINDIGPSLPLGSTSSHREGLAGGTKPSS